LLTALSMAIKTSSPVIAADYNESIQ